DIPDPGNVDIRIRRQSVENIDDIAGQHTLSERNDHPRTDLSATEQPRSFSISKCAAQRYRKRDFDEPRADTVIACEVRHSGLRDMMITYWNAREKQVSNRNGRWKVCLARKRKKKN